MRTIHVAVVACLGVVSIAAADIPPADESIRVVRSYVDYAIKSDGTATILVERSLSPAKKDAINALGQQTLSYQEGMQELEIFEAYTLKKDGRRIAVPDDRIVTQVAPSFANTPLYTDMKIKRMVFSDLEIGDQIVYRYQRTIKVPQFPGQFFDDEIFTSSRHYEDARITLKHPKSYEIYVQTRGLSEEPKREQGNDEIREWRYHTTLAIQDELGAVSQYDRDPVFYVTSFKSWSDIAHAYDVRARDKAQVTPNIQSLADDVTKNTHGHRQQALALYAWVVTNIRYVAVFLGAGGYVPHTADSILQNRYGDCKDYTTLLGALLDAEGIANEPVIVNASNQFVLPDVPTPAAFNHAILYLPEFTLYLDATARTLPFGALAPLEANKAALHTRSDKELARTPRLLAFNRTFTSDTAFSVNADGSIKGNTVVTARGVASAELLSLIDLIDKPQVSQPVLAGLMSLEGYTGSAEMKRVAGTSYKAEFQINNWIDLPGPGAVRLPSGLFGPHPMRLASMQALNSARPLMDHVCLPGVYEESSIVQLPRRLKITRLPKNIDYADSALKFKSNYEMTTNNIVKVSRRLEMDIANTVCKPEESAKLRDFFEIVRRDFAAQMLYE